MDQAEHRARILERRALFIGASLASLVSCSAGPLPEPPPPPAAGARGGAPAFGAAATAPSSSKPLASAAAIPPPAAAGSSPDAGPRPKLVHLVCLSIRIMERLRFAHGSTLISARSRELLDIVAEMLADYPDLRVELSGHSDSSERYAGQSLALRRAEAAERYLRSLGVAESRLCVRSYGDSRPLARPTTAQSRALNRRVEFRKLADDEGCAP